MGVDAGFFSRPHVGKVEIRLIDSHTTLTKGQAQAEDGVI
jgi:hypothetical protein